MLVASPQLSLDRAVLARTACNNPDLIVGQGPLQGACFSPGGPDPDVRLLGGLEDYGHGLRMDRRHHGIRIAGQEGEQVARRSPHPLWSFAQTSNWSRCRLSSWANQTGTFLPSGVVSYSLKDVKGTRHRLPSPSQRYQCGDFTFRTLVTPASLLLPFRAKTGDGIPQRPIVSVRSPSTIRMIGAGQSGNTPGMGGRLPVRSQVTRNQSRMADCPLLTLQRLHMVLDCLRRTVWAK